MSGVVDLELHFGDVFLRLEEVLVAEVGFNVISLDGLRAGLEDLPCERWVAVVQGEQEEHQAYGLVGSEREQEKSQTPAERRGSYGD